MRCLTLLCLIAFAACLSSAERDAAGKLKVLYKADEVRIHFPEEVVRDTSRKIAEVIILNSRTLNRTNTAFESGMEAAYIFYKSLKKKDKYFGIRVIIANPGKQSRITGFSKSYFYEMTLLGKKEAMAE